MKRVKSKGAIKQWKRGKVDESSKNDGGKGNETVTQVGNETDLSVERNDCSKSGNDHRRLKHDISVELGKWLMSREKKSCKGPVKETEAQREEEQNFLSSLLVSGKEKEKAISPFTEPNQPEKNWESNHVGRTDNEAGGNVESGDEEVVVRKKRRKSSRIITKGLSEVDGAGGG